jgi:hypothetical protein
VNWGKSNDPVALPTILRKALKSPEQEDKLNLVALHSGVALEEIAYSSAIKQAEQRGNILSSAELLLKQGNAKRARALVLSRYRDWISSHRRAALLAARQHVGDETNRVDASEHLSLKSLS